MALVKGPSNGISRRGFASQTKERRLELAMRGGKAAQSSGRAHRFSKQEAIEAGRKGGKVRKSDRRPVSF